MCCWLGTQRKGRVDQRKVANTEPVAIVGISLITNVANFQQIIAIFGKGVGQPTVGGNAGRVVGISQFDAASGVKQADHRIKWTAQPTGKYFHRNTLSGFARNLVIVETFGIAGSINSQGPSQRLGLVGRAVFVFTSAGKIIDKQ